MTRALILTILALGLAAAQAAVPVATVQTFDTAPVAADWSTVSIAGGGNTYLTASAIDTAVSGYAISQITTVLPTSSTQPPSTQANARYNTAGQFLQTRPTGNAATLLLATIQNNSGQNWDGAKISYTLNAFNSVTEEIPGHRVFFSTTGDANSWTLIEGLSGVATAGEQSAVILFSFPANGMLYLLWADDNGDGSTDGSFTIDNFLVSNDLSVQPVGISVQPPATINLKECQPLTISATVTGTAPITLQWYLNDNPIPNANSATYTVASVGLLDAGVYRLHAENNSGFNQVDSTTSTVSVTEDTQPPVVIAARAMPDLTNFVVTYSEPLNPQGFGDSFAYSLSANGFPLTMITNWLADTTNVWITIDSPRDPNAVVNLSINDSMISDACKPGQNFLVGTNLTLTQTFPLSGWDLAWKYEASGTDMGTAWRERTFNDSTWPAAPAPFEAFASSRVGTTQNGLVVNTWLPLHNEDTYLTDNIPTYYFRTHFNYPANATGLAIRHWIDDAAIIYINGVEVYRYEIGATATGSFTNYSQSMGDAGAGNTAIRGPIYVTQGLVAGDNVIAVELKQYNSTSSDAGMALELSVEAPEAPGCEAAVISTQPSSIAVPEGGSGSLSVIATGSKLQYQWSRNGGVIANATNSSYAATQAGSYTVRVYNECSDLTSSAATVTITADTTNPFVLGAATTPEGILVSFANTNTTRDWALNPQTATAVANYTISPSVNISSVIITNGTNVLLVTGPLPPASYTVTVKDVSDDAATPNVIEPNNVQVPVIIVVRLVNAGGTWSYEATATDLGTAWKETTFDASAWPTGMGAFGLEDDNAALGPLTNLVGGSAVNTVIQLTNAAGTRVPTYYLRTTFNNPITDMTGVSVTLRTIVDDGAVFYLNGQEVFRTTNMVANPVYFTNLATTAATEGQVQVGTNITGLVAGQNVLAVEVHQNSLTSSDWVFGAELVAQLGGGTTTRPRLTVTRTAGGAIQLSWTGSGTLQETTTVANPASWVPSANQANPQTITPATTGMKFYRVAQ